MGHDDEGMIDLTPDQMYDAEHVIEPVLSQYGREKTKAKKYKLIKNYLLQRELVVSDEAADLGIGVRTYSRWKQQIVIDLAERVDRFEKGNRRPRGRREFT